MSYIGFPNRNADEVKFVIGSSLHQDVYFLTIEAHSKGWLYDLRLCELEWNERDLNAGRFSRFRIQSYENQVVVPLSRSNVELHNIYEATRNHINWIDTNTKSGWSLSAQLANINICDLYWSFEDSADAMMFKLVWG